MKVWQCLRTVSLFRINKGEKKSSAKVEQRTSSLSCLPPGLCPFQQDKHRRDHRGRDFTNEHLTDLIRKCRKGLSLHSHGSITGARVKISRLSWDLRLLRSSVCTGLFRLRQPGNGHLFYSWGAARECLKQGVTSKHQHLTHYHFLFWTFVPFWQKENIFRRRANTQSAKVTGVPVAAGFDSPVFVWFEPRKGHDLWRPDPFLPKICNCRCWWSSRCWNDVNETWISTNVNKLDCPFNVEVSLTC